MITAKVIGESEVKLQLDKLVQSVDSSVIFGVLQTSAKILVDKMRELAPVSTKGVGSTLYASRSHPPGYLKSSIGIVKGKGKEYPTIWVRPRHTGSFDPWYEHLPQQKHKYVMPRSGAEGQTQKATPFVNLAWDAVGSTVKTNIETLLNSILERAAK